ncbi:hypothetical protein [uncultured Chitinophaga sp.]|jgi:hypothetical protein|uniref:hypothetical protein n=1 Tax=uncultured Chitinophaga sp. TaxID=339340 RepID=UPI00262103D4|nr:hypothetical protein [uncultured Chitinophaga sp.]
MKIVLIFFAAMAYVTLSEKDRLHGRWETKPSEKGNVTGVVFKADSTFEGYINKKPFVSGTYTLQDDIFTFTDNGCEGKRGVYKIFFFSNADSMRFVPITDSCIDRKEGMSRLVMGRVK